MSGHSHYSSIKYQKTTTDAKRSKDFSKLAREIMIAAKEGDDPETNSKLRVAIEKAKSINLPKENIERAIKKGIGQIPGQKLEEILLEAYGSGGIAIIIEGITDNKNRTIGEIKQILTQKGGKLVSEGAVKWLFERKGCITINPNSQTPITKEELELKAIEAGAEDIYWHNTGRVAEPRQGRDFLDVYAKIEDLERVKKNLEKKGINVESTTLDWVPKEEIKVDQNSRKNCQKLFEDLDENDAVQEIYSNLASS